MIAAWDRRQSIYLIELSSLGQTSNVDRHRLARARKSSQLQTHQPMPTNNLPAIWPAELQSLPCKAIALPETV
eukprot:scaffold75706_cov36-Prasinocladus_malaysianus.AAC.1